LALMCVSAKLLVIMKLIFIPAGCEQYRC
jgi:hypothetical protein